MISTITDAGTPFTATLSNVGEPTSVAVVGDGTIYFTANSRLVNSGAGTNVYHVINGTATLYKAVGAGALVLSVNGQVIVLLPTHDGWIVDTSNDPLQ